MSMTIVKGATSRADVEHRVTVEPHSAMHGRRELVSLIIQEGDRRARITINRTEAEGLVGAIKAALR